MQGTVAERLGAGNTRFVASRPFFFASVCKTDGAAATQMPACVTTAQGTCPLAAQGALPGFQCPAGHHGTFFAANNPARPSGCQMPTPFGQSLEQTTAPLHAQAVHQGP